MTTRCALRLGFALALPIVGGSRPALAYEKALPPAVVVLPAARSPTESLAAIHVPPDLQVELVATEPVVLDPIDLAWGADGRMWVVEMGDYPLGVDGMGQAGGRIVVLESTQGDGRYDRSTVFAEYLPFPTSVLPWREGVLVTVLGEIRYLEDTNGDGRSDRSTVMFTGLGEGNQQHLTNGLQWGLDGWLYLANGGTPGKLISPVSGESLEIGRRDLRIQPDEGRLESQSGRSQYGRNRDDWGNWFGGDNIHPIWHYALEDHYLRRNPHLAPPNGVIEVSEQPGAAPVFPASETLARFNDPTQTNHFTSACGTMVYRDDWLGPSYAGNLFVCEPVHNLVHRELVEPAGVTFRSRRASEEQQSEFLASEDNWSRFTSVRAGPDGALYVVDMYRLVIEHPEWIPDEWIAQLGDLRAGSEQGRIYRVYPKSGGRRPVPRLDQANVPGLVEALQSPSGLVRDLAQQQLVWRRATSAAPALAALVTSAPGPATRVQALWTLELLGELRPAVVRAGLADPHPGVRRHAVRLTERFAPAEVDLLTEVMGLVDDADAMVRQQVAYTLGEWRGPEAGRALARLARQSNDPLIAAAAMSSAPPHLAVLLDQLEPDQGIDPTLIEMAAAAVEPAPVDQLLRKLTAPAGGVVSTERLRATARLLEAVTRHRRAAGSTSGPDPVRELSGVLAAARKIAADPVALLDQRTAAVALLGREPAHREADLHQLAALLAPREPVEVQRAAVHAIAQTAVPNVPDRVLSGWSGYSPTLRSAVLELLVSRPEWALGLLERLAAEPSWLTEIDSTYRAALTHHRHPGVTARAAEVMSASLNVDRQQVIDTYVEATARLTADLRRGADVYGALCSACHQFGSVAGSAIGPDLASLKQRDPSYLITHILDPNRAVESRYLLYTVVTRDGAAWSGRLVGEAGNSLTLLGLDGVEQVIRRSDVASLTSSGRSLMPDGLELALEPSAMADLVAYLAGGNPPE
jgi:putative membrane-bound dehydrogenase-like protein